jgi:hypothetical protein
MKVKRERGRTMDNKEEDKKSRERGVKWCVTWNGKG